MRAWRDRRCEAVVQHPPLRRSACKRSGTQRPGRDHPPGCSRQSGASRCGRQRTSNSPAAPMPPPTHIVTTTWLAPRRRPSISACPTSPVPDIPYGVTDCDRAAVDVQPLVRDSESVPAVEHLDGERLVELPEADVVDRQLETVEQLRNRKTGPIPISSGSHPCRETTERPNAPSAAALASLASITTQAAAPSDSWLALPAVIVPPSVTGLSAASPSAVVFGRLHLSR